MIDTRFFTLDRVHEVKQRVLPTPSGCATQGNTSTLRHPRLSSKMMSCIFYIAINAKAPRGSEASDLKRFWVRADRETLQIGSLGVSGMAPLYRKRKKTVKIVQPSSPKCLLPERRSEAALRNNF
jgi:hypothetical protein